MAITVLVLGLNNSDIRCGFPAIHFRWAARALCGDGGGACECRAQVSVVNEIAMIWEWRRFNGIALVLSAIGWDDGGGYYYYADRLYIFYCMTTREGI